MSDKELFEELISLIIMQYEENKKLKSDIDLIQEHLEIYEEFIKGDNK